MNTALLLIQNSYNPSHNFLIIFFFNVTATTEIYTLSLHDALPICSGHRDGRRGSAASALAQGPTSWGEPGDCGVRSQPARDRKSTRLNSSHSSISYAVFCLKKKTSAAISCSSVRAGIASGTLMIVF